MDLHSSYPLHAQIKEQVKLALAFGELRAGDTLPSIRDLAQELGIGAGVIRRAYSELARAGILRVNRSRRAVVNRELLYKRDSKGLEEQTRRLASQVLDEVLKLGIHPQSFGQFFQHWLAEARACESLIIFTECNRLQAEQYAKEAAQSWGIPVRGLDFDALRRLSRRDLERTRHIITVPYHYEEAHAIARHARKNLVTVSVDWHPEVMRRIEQVGKGGRVAFVFERRDCEQYGRLIVKEIQGMFPDSGITFGCVVLQDIENLDRWLDEKKWGLAYFSNRIWDSLPESVRSRANVETPMLKANPVSLERARVEVGVLS